VEEYGLDELTASADRLVPGLGPLVRRLAVLAGDLGGAVTLKAMEQLAVARGRELICAVLQHGLDAQAGAEVRLAVVTGADGVARTRAERDHGRVIVTTLGQVRVARIAYRAGVTGVPALFPRDAALNLPLREYSWQLQELVVMFTRSGAYEQAQELITAATGIRIGKKQLEQITAEAAADAPGFYPALAPQAGQELAGAVPAPEAVPAAEEVMPLVSAMSADGKGVAMRPESRRKGSKAPGQRVRTFQQRRGTGEKGHKRMAETGAVFDIKAVPRTPEQVMAPSPPAGKDAPEALNRWYTVDIAADRASTVSDVFDQAERRDPGHARTWIALADGDIYQIGLFQDQAARRGMKITILVDFIHVLEYIWKVGWCFHEPRDPAIEDWVRAQALDILHGRAAEVTARIRQLAEDHPPQGSEHAKIIRKTLHYLDAKQPYLDYPAALAAGWPIATGVIEGACRHLPVN
jgi:pyruvate/2-oxoacid:ferredoxin oxidoreductase beta subunit